MGKRTGRLWLAGALLTLGAALVPGGLWLATEEPGQQRQRLPDGSSLALLGWTYGSSHVFRTGPRWQTLLWPIAPPQWQDRLGSVLELRRLRAPPGSLVLWMLRRPESLDAWPAYLEVSDERGATVITENIGTYTSAGSGNRAPEPWVLDFFPRRGQVVKVRPILPSLATNQVPPEAFSVPNPDPGPHPVWTAPPLPCSQSQAGLTFTLTRFVTSAGAGRAPALENMPQSRLTFHVTQNGRPSTNWYPAALELADATGNQSKAELSGNSTEGGDPVLRVRGPLDPGETYRLRVRFTNRAITERRDQWQLPPIPRPPLHATRPLRLVTTRNQVRIQVLEVLGPWARVPNRLSPEPFSYVRLLIPPEARSDRQVQLVRATDQRGRDLLVDLDPWAEGRDDSAYFCLDALPGVKTLHLTFGVHRSYEVEFLARPSGAPGGVSR